MRPPSTSKFLTDDKSLLESTTNALPADTVPGVTPSNVLISAAEEVIKFPANFNPTVVPL